MKETKETKTLPPKTKTHRIVTCMVYLCTYIDWLISTNRLHYWLISTNRLHSYCLGPALNIGYNSGFHEGIRLNGFPSYLHGLHRFFYPLKLRVWAGFAVLPSPKLDSKFTPLKRQTLPQKLPFFIGWLRGGFQGEGVP